MPDAEHRSEVVKAYTPYAIIIAIFSVANIPAVKEALAEEPWTFAFQWPGLNVANTAGEPLSSMTYNFNWFPAAGTLSRTTQWYATFTVEVGSVGPHPGLGEGTDRSKSLPSPRIGRGAGGE